MYEYTLREQALRQVLGCIFEEHPNRLQALAQIDELITQMMRTDGVIHASLLHEIEVVRAELGWTGATVPASLRE